MIYYSFAWESCPGEIYNKLLKMRIRLLHDGQPTTRAQVLLPQPSSPIRRSITTVRQLSWLSNPTSIDLFHFRMVLARHVMNRLFASIDSTHPAASSAAAIVPNVRLNGRQVYRLLFEEEDRDYIRMMRMIHTHMAMTVRAPPPARLASFGLRSKRG